MATTASYSYSNITDTSVDITIIPDSAYSRYRIYVRLYDDTSDKTYDKTYDLSSITTLTVSGLQPGTHYAVNVGYTNNSGSEPAVAGYIESKEFWTTETTIYYYVEIHYNANGGSGAPSTQTFSDTDNAITVTLSSTIPTKSNYTFLGWSFDNSATTADWQPGETYYNWLGSTDTEVVTLYAVWSKNLSSGIVYINGKAYIPYIYKNDGEWHRASAYIYKDKTWNVTIEQS